MIALQIERVRSLQALWRHRDALEVVGAAIRSEPSNPTLHSLRAGSLAALHDFDEADLAARFALSLAPDDPFGHFTLGKVLALKGDAGAARPSINRAIELAPDVADYHAILAATYAIEQRWSVALETVDRALQLDPENRTGLLLKARLLSLRGRGAEAMETVRSLMHVDPHYSPGLALHESLQREAGARDYPRLALQTDPRSSYVRSEALNGILHRSVAFRWLPAVDRLGMTLGARALALVVFGGGLLLWLSIESGMLSRTGRFGLPARAVSVAYSAFTFVFTFGWCVGDVYLRWHESGRWLLDGSRRKGAEVAGIASAAGGALLLSAAVLRSPALAHAAAGLVGGGLVVSRSLTSFVRLATPLEFCGTIVAASSIAAAVAAGAGLADRAFFGTLGACAAVACAARFSGWPRIGSRRG